MVDIFEKTRPREGKSSPGVNGWVVTAYQGSEFGYMPGKWYTQGSKKEEGMPEQVIMGDYFDSEIEALLDGLAKVNAVEGIAREEN